MAYSREERDLDDARSRARTTQNELWGTITKAKEWREILDGKIGEAKRVSETLSPSKNKSIAMKLGDLEDGQGRLNTKVKELETGSETDQRNWAKNAKDHEDYDARLRNANRRIEDLEDEVAKLRNMNITLQNNIIEWMTEIETKINGQENARGNVNANQAKLMIEQMFKVGKEVSDTDIENLPNGIKAKGKENPGKTSQNGGRNNTKKATKGSNNNRYKYVKNKQNNR